MSDPVPHNPSPDPAAAPSRFERPRSRPLWFLLSVVLHVAAAIALLLFTPLRQIILEQEPQKKRADVTMAADRLEDAAQQIEKINRDQIERDVREMHELLHEMEQVKKEQGKEFEVYEQQIIEQSPQQLVEMAEQVLEKMDAATEALQAENPQTAEQVRATDVEQALAEALQMEATARLELIDDDGALTQAQRDALAAQREAMKATAEHKQVRQDHQQTREAVERIRRDLSAEQKRVDERQSQVEDLATKVAEHEARAQERERTRDEAKESQNRQAEQQAERERRNAQTAADRERSQLQRRERELAESQKKLEGLTQQLEQREAQLTEREQAQTVAQEAAANKQIEARQQQAAVAEKIKEVVKDLAEQKLAQRQDEDAASQPQTPDTSKMDVLQLYEAARQTETQVTEQYREIRAMKLAMLREATLDQAREAIEQFAPVRPELDAAALTGEARTLSQFERKRAQIETAVTETSGMVSLANLLLSQARQELSDSEGLAISLDAIQARSAAMQALETLASVDISGKATDVTAAMKAVTAASTSTTSSEGSGGEQADNAGAKAAAPASTTSGKGEAGHDGGAAAVAPSQSRDASRTTPPTIPSNHRPVFGRKVADDGDAAAWMGINTWYIIGPWPNPGRVNIDRSFPPENLVDLDATYIGKDNQTIRWEFVQSGSPRGVVMPTNAQEYGIWYAFTELHFDRPRDLWVAMGSDDKGRMWINDVPVWVSADTLKDWNPAEAYRRVHFQQGRNRILFRCENGWRGMGFSLWIYLPEGEPPTSAAGP